MGIAHQPFLRTSRMLWESGSTRFGYLPPRPHFQDDNNDGGNSGGAPQDGGTGGSTPPAGNNASGGDDKDAIIKSLREEAAARRVEARELKKQLDSMGDVDGLKKQIEELRQKSMTQEEREKERIKELEQRASRVGELEKNLSTSTQELKLENALLRLAAKKGFDDPDDAVAIFDRRYRGKLETDDKGNFTNLEALIDELAKDRPNLLRQQNGSSNGVTTPNIGASNPGRSGAPQVWTMERVRALTAREWADDKIAAEASAFLANHSS